MKKISILLSLTFLMLASRSQNINGSWYGKADFSNGNGYNNYLIELIIKENGNQVQGIIGYYFKNTYQSFLVKGAYNKNTRELNIRNVPIMNYAATSNEDLECPMNFSGAIMISKVKSSLVGYFYSSDALKYKCPDLKVNLQKDETDHSSEKLADMKGGEKRIWKSPPNQVFINTAVPVQTTTNKPAETIFEKKSETAAVTKTEVPTTIPALVAKVTVTPSSEEKRAIEAFEKRSNNYISDLEVISDSIRVSFYDNGEVDGDTISVFINKIPVILQKGISTRALTTFIKLDPTRVVNELSMLAENLGKYPPNTALMVLSDGFNTYEIYLSSSFTQNATVRLKRKKK